MIRIKRKEPIALTKYIVFDANKCEACWDCISSCNNGVLGKVNLFFHKHTRLAKPDACKGCLKCIKACANNAFSRV